MNVHNLMEDIVIKAVNTLYDRVKGEAVAWLTCDCENCRLDTVSYVLNRIPPKYVVSGRGVTHNAEYLASSQLQADVDSLALEGMRTVSSTKRPFHTEDRKDCIIHGDDIHSKPAFNFFTFMGIVLDGNTFEPVPKAKITLKMDGKLAEMVDKTWSNPYNMVPSTKGVYSFWVKSIPANETSSIILHTEAITLSSTPLFFINPTAFFLVSCVSGESLISSTQQSENEPAMNAT